MFRWRLSSTYPTIWAAFCEHSPLVGRTFTWGKCMGYMTESYLDWWKLLALSASRHDSEQNDSDYLGSSVGSNVSEKWETDLLFFYAHQEQGWNYVHVEKKTDTKSEIRTTKMCMRGIQTRLTYMLPPRRLSPWPLVNHLIRSSCLWAGPLPFTVCAFVAQDILVVQNFCIELCLLC